VEWPRVGGFLRDNRPKHACTWGGLSGKERTALKREASTTNGTKFGRPRKVDDTEHIATAKRMKADGYTGKDIAGRPIPKTTAVRARHPRLPGVAQSGR
jgi:hypothetical protein